MEPISEKSNNSVLKKVFIVLLLFLIAELGFFIFNTNKKVLKTINNSKPIISNFFSEFENQTSNANQPINMNMCLHAQDFSNSDLAVLQTSNYFLEKKVANQSYLLIEYQGEIVGFEKNAARLLPKDYKLEFYLKLQRDVSGYKEPFDFIFDIERLKKTIVKNKDGKVISYKDLKAGQNIRIIAEYDIKSKLYSSYEINIIDN